MSTYLTQHHITSIETSLFCWACRLSSGWKHWSTVRHHRAHAIWRLCWSV
jgi:hypothetical protein